MSAQHVVEINTDDGGSLAQVTDVYVQTVQNLRRKVTSPYNVPLMDCFDPSGFVFLFSALQTRFPAI